MTCGGGRHEVTSEIRISWLITCRDRQGRTVKIGIGATEGGRVVLVGAPGGVAVLNAEQADEYLDRIRRAVTATSTGLP